MSFEKRLNKIEQRVPDTTEPKVYPRIFIDPGETEEEAIQKYNLEHGCDVEKDYGLKNCWIVRFVEPKKRQ